MNTFKWNLQRFQKAMGFSRTDIQELSELSDDELSILEEDADTTFNPKLLHKFCLQTGIDLTTIYSDKGFEVVDAISQFRACPDDLKFMITCQLFKKLKELAGSEAMLKSILTKELPDMKKSISRYCNGTSRLEADQLTKVATVLDKINLIKASELMDIVLELKYKWIPNYNYRALKAHYNLSYSEVAERLGVKVSLVNNWGGLNCIHFPAKFFHRVSVMFGYYDVAEFATTIISTKVADMEGRTCMNVEEMAPYREEVKLTKAGKQVSKKAKKAKKDPVDYVPPVTSNETTSSIQPCKTGTGTAVPTKMLPSDVHVVTLENFPEAPCLIEITDERIAKMYNKLSSEDKAKVYACISDLFFASL